MGVSFDCNQYPDKKITAEIWQSILARIKTHKGEIDYADFKGAEFQVYANFSMSAFPEEKDFTDVTFLGKTDFSQAVFKDGCSFEGAKFYTDGEDVLFEEAVFLSDDKDIRFVKAEFGRPYRVRLDDCEIGFYKKEKNIISAVQK